MSNSFGMIMELEQMNVQKYHFHFPCYTILGTLSRA